MPWGHLESSVIAAVTALAVWAVGSLASAALLWLRLRTLRAADQVTISRFTGRLVRIGPFRVELEQSGGGRVLLPNVVALFFPIVMQRQNEAAQVALRLDLPPSLKLAPERMRTLRKAVHAAAVLAPYRDGRSPVETIAHRDHFEVQLALTRLSSQDEMQHYLRGHLEAALERRGSSPSSSSHAP